MGLGKQLRGYISRLRTDILTVTKSATIPALTATSLTATSATVPTITAATSLTVGAVDLVPKPYGATLVVGAEVPNTITVAGQFTDAAGNALAVVGSAIWYLASDATGLTPSGSAPDGGTAAGTDGALIEWAANLSGVVVSEADGDFDIALTESGVATWYLVIVLPDGTISVSAAITF